MQITEILKQCIVDGNSIKLPSVQLDRNTYLEVKKSLELIGGKWKGGKTQAFVFNEDPTEYLNQISQGEKINLKKEFQFFATPDELAERLVRLADIHQPGQLILEPSAGQGAIAKAINMVYPNEPVYCYELMPLNQTFLKKLPYVELLGEDFLHPDGTHPAQKWEYDRIIANPPFSKNQDIEHVYEMYRCLNSTGRLVSVMSNHWRNTTGKKEVQFQQFIKDLSASVEEIESGAFKESGTNISACIVVIDKDPSIQPLEFTRTTSINTSKISKQNSTSRKITSTKVTTNEELPEPDEILRDLIQSESEIRTGLKDLVSMLNESAPIITPNTAQKKLEACFTDFTYQFSASEVFIDFVDYALLVMKWWEQERDFSYWQKKYTKQFPKFKEMIELLGSASEGFHDAMGDLFMEMVSHGRNGQYFSPDHVCDMMSTITTPELTDGKTALDCACGSGRMLLAAAKRNRHIFLFGNDIDSTCCKMAVLNLLLNSLQGEIAQMDALTMNYQRSWEVSYRNVGGANLPVYREIINKDDSVFWKLHMNSFSKKSEQEETKPEITKEESITSITPTPTIQKATQLQLF